MSAPPPATAGPIPLRGLVPYGEAGRGLLLRPRRRVRLVAANLLASRLTLLYGPSGVGKSSLLHAGVVHACGRQPDLVGRRLPRLARRPGGRRSVRRSAQPRATRASAATASPRLAVQSRRARAARPRPGRHPRPVRGVLPLPPDEDGDGTFAVEFPRAVNQATCGSRSWSRSARTRCAARPLQGADPRLFGNYLRVDRLDRKAAPRGDRAAA